MDFRQLADKLHGKSEGGEAAMSGATPGAAPRATGGTAMLTKQLAQLEEMQQHTEAWIGGTRDRIKALALQVEKELGQRLIQQFSQIAAQEQLKLTQKIELAIKDAEVEFERRANATLKRVRDQFAAMQQLAAATARAQAAFHQSMTTACQELETGVNALPIPVVATDAAPMPSPAAASAAGVTPPALADDAKSLAEKEIDDLLNSLGNNPPPTR